MRALLLLVALACVAPPSAGRVAVPLSAVTDAWGIPTPYTSSCQCAREYIVVSDGDDADATGADTDAALTTDGDNSPTTDADADADATFEYNGHQCKCWGRKGAADGDDADATRDGDDADATDADAAKDGDDADATNTDATDADATRDGDDTDATDADATDADATDADATRDGDDTDATDADATRDGDDTDATDADATDADAADADATTADATDAADTDTTDADATDADATDADATRDGDNTDAADADADATDADATDGAAAPRRFARGLDADTTSDASDAALSVQNFERCTCLMKLALPADGDDADADAAKDGDDTDATDADATDADATDADATRDGDDTDATDADAAKDGDDTDATDADATDADATRDGDDTDATDADATDADATDADATDADAADADATNADATDAADTDATDADATDADATDADATDADATAPRRSAKGLDADATDADATDADATDADATDADATDADTTDADATDADATTDADTTDADATDADATDADATDADATRDGDDTDATDADATDADTNDADTTDADATRDGDDADAADADATTDADAATDADTTTDGDDADTTPVVPAKAPSQVLLNGTACACESPTNCTCNFHLRDYGYAQLRSTQCVSCGQVAGVWNCSCYLRVVAKVGEDCGCTGEVADQGALEGGDADADAAPFGIAVRPESPLRLNASTEITYAFSFGVPGVAGATMHYTYDNVTGTIYAAVESIGTNGYLAVGFPKVPGKMVGASAMLFSDHVQYLLLRNQTVQGVVAHNYLREAHGVELVTAERVLAGNATARRAGRALQAQAQSQTRTVLRFAKKAWGAAEAVDLLVSRHATSLVLMKHDAKTSFTFNFVANEVAIPPAGWRGAADGDGDVDVDGDGDAAQDHSTPLIHGALMITGWCWLIPMGVIFKRYGKTCLGLGNSISWKAKLGASLKLHYGLIGLGLCCIISAFGVIMLKERPQDADADGVWVHPYPNSWEETLQHRKLGPVIIGLAGAMPLIVLWVPMLSMAPGHPLRVGLSWAHKLIGRGLLVLAIHQVFTGIQFHTQYNATNGFNLRIYATVGVALNVGAVIILETLHRNYRVFRRGPMDRIETVDRIAWAEVRQHDTMQDPWVVVNGRVYGVRAWLYTHPGGPQVLMGYAGKDGTDDFRDIGHSAHAKQRMENYYVGDIEDDRMVSAEDVAEEVTSSLVCLRLQYASDSLMNNRALLPDKLHDAFDKLVRNIESYLPFLPPALVAEIHDEIDGMAESEVERELGPESTKNSDDGGDDDSGSGRSSGSDSAAESSRRSSRQSTLASKKMSIASSLQGAKAAAGVVQRGNSLAKNKITLMYITMYFPENVVVNLTDYPRYHELYLMTIIAQVNVGRGVVDMFVGNRAVCPFNAYRPAVQHPTKAIAALKGVVNETASIGTGFLTAAVVCGNATVGTLGTSSMRRPSIVGPIVDLAAAYEKYAALGGHRYVGDATVYDNANCEHQMKMLLDRMYVDEAVDPCGRRGNALVVPHVITAALKNAPVLPVPPKGKDNTDKAESSAPKPSLVYTITHEPATGEEEEGECDEWMYELENSNVKDFEFYNEAAKKLLMKGNLGDAVAHLEKSKPEQVDAFKAAVDAGCVVDFRAKVFTKSGDALAPHALCEVHEALSTTVCDVLSTGEQQLSPQAVATM